MQAASNIPSVIEAQGDLESLGAELCGEKPTDQASDDFVSLDWLIQRWLCSPKTARQKVRAIGLGIRPAGTWLVSKSRVEAYEALLFSKAPSGSDILSIGDQRSARALEINENLRKFGVTENADLKRRLLNLTSSRSRKAG